MLGVYYQFWSFVKIFNKNFGVNTLQIISEIWNSFYWLKIRQICILAQVKDSAKLTLVFKLFYLIRTQKNFLLKRLHFKIYY
jgi:hypothetical protein